MSLRLCSGQALRSRLPVLLLLLAAFALSSSPLMPESGPGICPLSQVRAGQIAVAKSVFRGAKIESFHVRIIGVVPRYDGARSIIFGQVLDGPVVTRGTGVIGGMSGSPVYINGRLAGAIALTYAFSKEPIAGITPIEDMLDAWREPTAKPKPAAGGERLAAPVRIGGKTVGSVRIAPVPPSEPDPPGVMTMVPLGGLLQASGFGPRALEQLQRDLQPYGLHIAAAGGGVEEKMRPPMVPGAALGARLIGGDFDMTFLGTVTMVEGNRVLGFGHPMFARGDVDLPMTGGYVYDILPSIYLSNKMMAPTQVVGRIFRDHQSAVAGALGGKADMLPVTIEVSDEERRRSRVFRVEVARVQDLTPSLVASSVAAAVDETRGGMSRGMARVRVEMEAAGRTLAREDVDYSATDAAMLVAPAVVQPLTMLTENAFGTMRVDRLRVRVETSQTRKTASIERVTVDRSRVQAGDEVTLTVTLHPYGAPPTDIPVKLRIPADLPKGQVRIAVTRGTDADQGRGSIGAPRPAPVNAQQLVERYLSQGKSSDLVVQAALPRPGASLAGEELPGLPRTAVEALGASRPTDLRPLPSVMKIVVPTDWALTGRQAVTIPVESTVPAAGGPSKPPGEGPPEEGGQTEEETGVLSALPEARPLTLRASGVQLAAAPKGAAAQAPGSSEEKKEQAALTRAPEMWNQSSAADYATWKLSDVSLTGEGVLALSLKTQELARVPADVIWAVAARGGAAYVGTGRDGRVFRVGADGQLSQFASTGEMNVHALAFAPDGALYAGTSPRGKVFRIGADGTCELAFDTDSTYIWALAIAADGTLYAGAGSPARVYALKLGAKPSVVAELPVANVLSLALGQDGGLYVGTSDLGLIYRIEPGGSMATIGQVPGASVDGLALDSQGNLYATCSPGGQVYRVAPGGKPELYLETGEQTAFDLALLPDSTPVVTTGPTGLVVRASGKLKAELLFRPESGIATAIAQDGGALFIGATGPSALYRLGPERATAGVVESDALDAQRPASWGRVDLTAEIPEGTRVGIETRSGDSPICVRREAPDEAAPGGLATAKPWASDEGWRPWTPAAGGAIASPPARYLQYRLLLSATPTGPAEPASGESKAESAVSAPAPRTPILGLSPIIRQITVSRRAQNLPPRVTIRGPEAGRRLSKQQTVTWQAQDPDKDSLAFRLEVSPDLGLTWSEIAKDLRDPKYDWDTTKQKDGQYLLRATASDALGQPDDPRAGDDSEVIWVDNTAPSLLLFKASLAVDQQRRATASVMASDKLSPIQSVEYRVDEGEWRSAPIGVVESPIAAVTIVTDPLEVGKRKLSVRAFDAAGNVATESTEVEVKEPKPAEPAPPQPAAEQSAKTEAPAAEQKPAASEGPEPVKPPDSSPAAPAAQP